MTILAELARDIERARIGELESQLREAHETLDAIRNGEVDAVVVTGVDGPKVYTLESADRTYRELVEQMQEGAVTLAGDGTILYCNRRFANLLGTAQERVTGAALQQFVIDADQAVLAALMCEVTLGGGRGEITIVSRGGDTLPVFVSLSELPGEGLAVFCAVVTDLTQHKERTRALAEANARLTSEIAEREHAEALLRQAQKMEAVGQLTGGLAHDFNNLLATIIGNLEILQRRVEDGRFDIGPFVDGAIKGAMRAASLTQRLLAFSRRQNLQPEAIRVDELMPDLEMLIRRAIGVDITLRMVAPVGLWHCCADPNQLEAAILNLAINARDAVAQGGIVTIEMTNVTLDAAEVAGTPDQAPGRYVRVTVSGHGPGHDARDSGPRVRAVLHHQGRGQGLGPGPQPGLRFRPPVGRLRRHRQHAGAWHHGPARPAVRGPTRIGPARLGPGSARHRACDDPRGRGR